MRTFKSKKEIQDAIKKQITTNDKQAIKALLRIYEYQTASEQESMYVYNRNNVGFTKTDSSYLSKMVKDYYRYNHYLNPKIMDRLKRSIGKYAGQLVRIAISKGIYEKVDGVWIVKS